MYFKKVCQVLLGLALVLSLVVCSDDTVGSDAPTLGDDMILISIGDGSLEALQNNAYPTKQVHEGVRIDINFSDNDSILFMLVLDSDSIGVYNFDDDDFSLSLLDNRTGTTFTITGGSVTVTAIGEFIEGSFDLMAGDVEIKGQFRVK